MYEWFLHPFEKPGWNWKQQLKGNRETDCCRVALWQRVKFSLRSLMASHGPEALVCTASGRHWQPRNTLERQGKVAPCYGSDGRYEALLPTRPNRAEAHCHLSRCKWNGNGKTTPSTRHGTKVKRLSNATTPGSQHYSNDNGELVHQFQPHIGSAFSFFLTVYPWKGC